MNPFAPKPQTPVKKAPPPSEESGVVVRLSCNSPAKEVEGMDDFISQFKETHATLEIIPFRYVIQRKSKRGIGGKFSQGISTEVTENVEINPNEDLFGLRRWLGTIRQDPSSLILLNITKIKEFNLAAPLIFSEMLKTGRPILVSGADSQVKAQLYSTVDPTFTKIPPEITQDPTLKTALLARVQRKKGFTQSIRHLLEFDFFPESIRERVNKINQGGDPTELSEAEIINLCILSDLTSRYRAVLAQFKEAMEKGSLQVPQLIAMFDLLTADFPVPHAVKTFQDFLDEGVDPSKITSKSILFANIFQFISGDDGSTRQGKMDRLGLFHRKLTNVFVRHRVRVDPFLWKKSYFLTRREKTEQAVFEGLIPFYHLLEKTLKKGESAIDDDFKGMVAKQTFELISLANSNTSKFTAEADFARYRAGNEALALFHKKNGGGLDMTAYQSPQGGPKTIEEFSSIFLILPLTIDDLKGLAARLRPTLFFYQSLAKEIQKGTLDVMGNMAKEKGKILRDIYIVNAISEVVTYPFHLGDKKLTNLERIGLLSLGQTRLGLDVTPNPVKETSVGLFTTEGELPPNQLKNEPNMLRLAYTELLGIRLEKLVKKAVDKKIHFLQQTYGENFFEVIYNTSVTNNDLPLSRNQFAQFIKTRKIMGNLETKGWKHGNENDQKDPFLVFAGDPKELAKKKGQPTPLDNFEKTYTQAISKFRQWSAELKNTAESDPREENPYFLIWNLFKQGIYNFSRNEAKVLFRKSIYYKHLQELIAKISSENFTLFTQHIEGGGVKIYIPWKFSFLTLIGTRFGFLVGEDVIKYHLLPSPTDKPEELDEVSRILYEKLGEAFAAQDSPATQSLAKLGEVIEKSSAIWTGFSQHLTIALVDRVLGDTLIKDLVPGKIGPNNLWFLPDSRKLCLGRAVTSSQAVPFAKILQNPENMGNIVKYTRSSSTTLDEFTIQIHNIGRLQEELINVAGLTEDMLDIIQGLSHDRRDGPAIAKYEQALQQLARILNKPIRHLGEEDVQALHVVGKQIQELMQTFFNSPSTSKLKVTTRMQAELQARRSDAHHIKLNFTDQFVIDKTEIKIMAKVKKGDETVKRQRKIEVESTATHQTLPLRIRDMIRMEEILAQKRHIVFSPEGHKKKQVDYAMSCIHILLALKGNATIFYVDTSGLAETQVQEMAKRVKPHNFFHMNEVRPTPPEGMKTAPKPPPGDTPLTPS